MKTTRFTALAAATLFTVALSPVLAKAGCPLEALLCCRATTTEAKAKNIVETAFRRRHVQDLASRPPRPPAWQRPCRAKGLHRVRPH